jgi:hypothetical protein
MPATVVRFSAALAAIFVLLVNSRAADASCQSGTLPGAGDIRYVLVSQFELPNSNHPSYKYQAELHDARAGHPLVADVRLRGVENVPKIGDFAAGKPSALFRDVVAVLQTRSFFGMRLTPAPATYLDGPEDSISVGACGMKWTLSTVATSQEFDLSDQNATRFFALEDALRTTIFAAEWIPASSER